jgi:hypothetical protein
MGTARERHSNGRKVHNSKSNAEDRPRHVLTGNADQHWCSLSAGLPIGLVMGKPSVAWLERTRPRKQRLTVLEVQELRSTFSLCPPILLRGTF